MSLEKEIKFEHGDFGGLRRILSGKKACFVHRVFEHNQVFDTGQGELRQSGSLLRLRQGAKSVLCLKTKPEDSEQRNAPRIKVWNEIQTQVQDAQAMQALLEGLGYREAFCYQKVREKWMLGHCAVCLDQVPFGRYVEIEGEPEEIWKTARELGLENRACTGKSYHELHREWRQSQNLPQEESFVFPEQEKARLLEELNLPRNRES